MNKDYHTALNAINIIFSMIPQFNEELATNLLNKVELIKIIEDDKVEIIQDLKLFLKNILDNLSFSFFLYLCVYKK